jgi:hypothetical protein
MNFLNKIQLIKKIIKKEQEIKGNEFIYTLGGFSLVYTDTQENEILISSNEHVDIIRYLVAKGFITIIGETPLLPSTKKIGIKVLPPRRPIISLKNLQLIAEKLGNYYKGNEIVTLLKNIGVREDFINYPYTEWRIFYDIFEELAVSNDTNDINLLFKIIIEATKISDKLRNEIDLYLGSDNLCLVLNDKGVYEIKEYPLYNEEIEEIAKEIEKNKNKIKGIEEQADLKESLTQDKNFGGAQKERQSLLEVSDKDAKPYTKVIDGKGYLKFYKEGEKILIGGKNTRPFRLLQCLCEPYFGVQKTIDAVFEAIRLPKDKNDSSLTEYSPQRKTRMLTLIEDAKKELQKGGKMKKIKFKYNPTKTIMWLELEE